MLHIQAHAHIHMYQRGSFQMLYTASRIRDGYKKVAFEVDLFLDLFQRLFLFLIPPTHKPIMAPRFNSFLQVIAHADKFPHEFDPKNPDEVHHTIPFRLGPYIVGRILPSTLPALIEYNDAQQHPPFEIVEGSYISFASWVNSFEKRSQVMKDLLETWRANKTFKVLAGN